jgi:hypothetical protein
VHTNGKKQLQQLVDNTDDMAIQMSLKPILLKTLVVDINFYCHPLKMCPF